MLKSLTKTLLIGSVALGLAAPANAQNGACYLPNSTCSQVTAAACATAGGVFGGAGVPCPPYQVNGAGATLFADFSTNAALTNDFINIDYDFGVDFVSGTPVMLRDIWNLNDGNGPQADQCGPTSPASLAPNQVWWIHQYRSVGSVEGYEEFINYQLCGDLPESLPSERGSLNSLLFANLGTPSGLAAAAGWGTPPGSACALDFDPGQADGPNASNSPVCPTSIDYANLDVPAVWATRALPALPPGDTVWNRKPGEPSFGQNPLLTYYDPDSAQSNDPIRDRTSKLASLDGGDYGCGGGLDLETATPGADTLFDTEIAWSPVGIIANRGTAIDANVDGTEDGVVSFTQLQHGFVTGRLPSGQNLVFAVRDVGSGTRNAAMNSLGIDPAYGIGDNDGARVVSPPNPAGYADLIATLGPSHQTASCSGSGVMETVVQNRRLAVGYTGVFGSSRTQGDTRAGRFEALSVIKNISDGDEVGMLPVSPTLDAILNNSSANTGWQIGGIQTLVTRGNPRAHDFGAFAPLEAPGDPLLANREAAKFVRNIEESIAVPVGTPPRIMPGQFIALNSTVVAAVDSIPRTLNPNTDPTIYDANSALDGAIQTYVRNNNTLRPGNQPIPAYGDVDSGGTIRPAGHVPQRRAPAKAITEPTTAGNGLCNTTADGDDIQVVAPGSPVTPGQTVVTAGPNAVLNSSPAGDETSRDVVSYKDGGNAADSSYRYWDPNANGGLGQFNRIGTSSSQALSRRNRVQGDFGPAAGGDGRRDMNDIARLVNAYYQFYFSGQAADDVLTNFEPVQSTAANDIGSMTVDRLIVHITGDFDGDGEFDARDLRYFADGLAVYPYNDANVARRGELDRKEGFIRVDNAFAGLCGSCALTTPFGPITLATGLYDAGDARGDVAGSAYIQPGGNPRGWDGRIDCVDIAYVEANFVSDWSNLDAASGRDLSCDMDGDLDVDCDDVEEIVVNILDSQIGDVNLDGVVDQDDCDVAAAHLGQSGGYCDGDVNCDGIVTAADINIICPPTCPGGDGDANCDNAVDFFDIDPFLLALFNLPAYQSTYCGGNVCSADVDDSGAVDFFDIDPFLTCLFNGCP